MRRRSAGLIASAQQSMSLKPARASPHTTAFLARLAISLTAAKSPSEAIGNPASITSTPIVSSSSATSSFSSCVMVAPGHCSPSRKVVSKMRTRSSSLLGAVAFGAVGLAAGLAGALARLVLPLFMTRSLSLAPVPVPHSSLGDCCGALGFGGGDPLSAQAQWPSRPSGGDKEQEPAENEGGAGAGFSLAVDRAKIAADRHRHCPFCAHKGCASTLPQGSRIEVNSTLIASGRHFVAEHMAAAQGLVRNLKGGIALATNSKRPILADP